MQVQDVPSGDKASRAEIFRWRNSDLLDEAFIVLMVFHFGSRFLDPRHISTFQRTEYGCKTSSFDSDEESSKRQIETARIRIEVVPGEIGIGEVRSHGTAEIRRHSSF